MGPGVTSLNKNKNPMLHSSSHKFARLWTRTPESINSTRCDHSTSPPRTRRILFIARTSGTAWRSTLITRRTLLRTLLGTPCNWTRSCAYTSWTLWKSASRWLQEPTRRTTRTWCSTSKSQTYTIWTTPERLSGRTWSCAWSRWTCEEVPRDVCRNQREEWRVQEVLRADRRVLEARDPCELRRRCWHYWTCEVQRVESGGWSPNRRSTPETRRRARIKTTTSRERWPPSSAWNLGTWTCESTNTRRGWHETNVVTGFENSRIHSTCF